jgi:radical SAM protein with 4Fe4S-binding SPASM domain
MTPRPVQFGLDSISPWDETALSALDRELTRMRERGLTEACPSFFTPPSPGQFTCKSENRLTIDPEGYIWGCHEFYDLFQQHPRCGSLARHRVGHVDMPRGELQALLAQWPVCEGYEQRQFLAGDEACLVCDLFQFCAQCPVNGAYTTHELRRLPPWVCGIQRALSRHRRDLGNPKAQFSSPPSSPPTN